MALVDYIGIFFLHFPILLTDDCTYYFSSVFQFREEIVSLQFPEIFGTGK
jgi:hypothetical protein